MALHWTDSLDIALELIERHPDCNPATINFVDLRNKIMQLPDFNDNPEHCGEKILEAVQMAWIAELD